MTRMENIRNWGVFFFVFGLVDGLYHFLRIHWHLSGTQYYNYRAFSHFPTVIYVSILLMFVGLILFKCSSDSWRRVLFLQGMVLSIFSLLLWNVIPVNRHYGQMIHALLLVFLALLPAFYNFAKRNTNYDLPKSKNTTFVEILCYVLIVALSIETAFRLVPIPNTFDTNPAIKFYWRDWVYYPLNNCGHRDRPFQLEKPDHIFRIIVVGDSFTEGSGVSREETFCHTMEKGLNHRLKQTGRRAQVYNMGHCGLNTVEEVDLAIAASKKFNPDMIIIAFFLNDVEQHNRPAQFSPKSLGVTIEEFFLYQMCSYTYYFILNLPVLVNTDPANEIGWTESMLRQYRDTALGWNEAKQALKRMSSFASDNGIITIGIVFPLFYGDHEYPLKIKGVHKKIVKAMNDNNIPGINLTPLFEETGEPLGAFAFSGYDSHPNSRSHKMVGNFLADHIAKTYFDVSSPTAMNRTDLKQEL